MSRNQWTYPYARRRRPLYRLGTLTSVGYRYAMCATDDGQRIQVILPAGLAASEGYRVGLVRYPDGWVVGVLVREAVRR